MVTGPWQGRCGLGSGVLVYTTQGWAKGLNVGGMVGRVFPAPLSAPLAWGVENDQHSESLSRCAHQDTRGYNPAYLLSL